MPGDKIPKLSEWLDEFRNRPDPVEVVVAEYDLVTPVPDDPSEGIAAGQVGIRLTRHDEPGKPPDVQGPHHVLGVDPEGRELWDNWYETRAFAEEAIADGSYGALRPRPS